MLIADFEQRLRALSTVHDLLSDTGWAPVEVQEVLRLVGEATIAGSAMVRSLDFHVHGDGAKLAKDQANNLALVAGELVVNSLKHCAFNLEDLKLSIAVKHNHTGIEIRYADNGKGYPQSIVDGDFSLANIGLELVNGIVTRAMSGKVHYANDGGAVTTLSFPTEETE
jgi:two-component sensor histidine kinase